MPAKVAKPARYCRQVEKGRADRAYTIIAGQRVHLGAYGSPASYERYTKAVNRPADKPAAEPAPVAFTVTMLLAAYLEFAIAATAASKRWK